MVGMFVLKLLDTVNFAVKRSHSSMEFDANAVQLPSFRRGF